MQIFHALGAVKRGLCSCVSNAFQHCLATNRCPCTEQFGKQTRLIESAFPLASWMQWHGNNQVEFTSAKAFIIKCRTKPARDEMSQVNLAPVLKVVNDLADDSATAVRGNRGVKVNRAMSTVSACECARDSTFERLGALLAKRRNDAQGLCLASRTEIFASSSLAAADRAHRRVKERGGRFEQFKLAKRDHISASCALPAS